MIEKRIVPIMRIPQMILMTLANPFALPASINSRMPHRMLVTSHIMLNVPAMFVLACPSIMVNKIIRNHMTAEMVLMTLANPLCFIESLSRRTAHRVDPMKRMSIAISRIIPIVGEKIDNRFVGMAYMLKN